MRLLDIIKRGYMKKLNALKVIALILIIISAFTPLAKIASNPVDVSLNPQVITFLSQENLKSAWYTLVFLSFLLLVIDSFMIKTLYIMWFYRIILFLLISAIYLIRSDMKKIIDTIQYSSGGFLPAFLDWGWYLIYVSVILFIRNNKN